MDIIINDQSHIVEVWLTNADQTNPQVTQDLLALRNQYRGTQYSVVEYHSGRGDMYTQTRDLLLHNRIRAAQMQVEQKDSHYPQHTNLEH